MAPKTIESRKQIVVFDWTTKKSEILPTRLKAYRWQSSCSLLRDQHHGSLSVAIFGGRYSLGLEVWNPEDGTVTTLEPLPSSIENLASSQLISINDNNDLLLYGGYSGEYKNMKYHDEVWRYTSADDTWTKVATMLGPKSSFVVLPLENIECD
jgi:hypothetical protein